ncbi:MAG TPA: polymer-forming cytoskeletal protein [Candidatus Binatia bacterium]|nr:polymer-forming cytoskeletal protein [Candidatus Binatia bacterium]
MNDFVNFQRITTSVIVAVILLFSVAAAQERAGSSGSAAQVTVPPSQVVSGDYFAFGERVEIYGTINGDLYASGGRVVIAGRVNGDVLAAGGRVSVSGTVSQDVRTAGGQVNITGDIGRNLTVAGGSVDLASTARIRGGLVAAGGSVELSAPLGGPAKVAAQSLVLANRVGGNIDAAAGSLRVSSNADIQGDLNYWSGREASVAEGARIAGKTVRNVPAERPRFFPAAVVAWAVFVAINFISTLILGLLSVRFLPRFHQSVVATLRERPWASLAIGFIAVVVLPVLCAILFATLVAIPLGLILAAAFFLLLYWSRIYAIARIGEAILIRLHPASGRAAAFVLGLFVYYALAIVPFVGWLIVPLVVLFGLGSELIARKQFYLTARSQDLL